MPTGTEEIILARIDALTQSLARLTGVIERRLAAGPTPAREDAEMLTWADAGATLPKPLSAARAREWARLARVYGHLAIETVRGGITRGSWRLVCGYHVGTRCARTPEARAQAYIDAGGFERNRSQ